MPDAIETVILNNVEVQANGIIRNSKGRLIARLVDGVDFNGEHIKYKDDTDNISDGYHTFGELYEHRIALFIALCRKAQDFRYHGDARNHLGDEKIVWCSVKHSDGSKFDDWFILGIGKEKGKQITYHLPAKYWSEVCEFAEVLDKAPEWDKHTSADVLERLKSL